MYLIHIMELLYIILVFVVVCILYFHIIYQYKVSEDLEIYEMDYKDNASLQETCNINQPVIFDRGPFELPNLRSCKQILNVKDINDYYKGLDSVDSVELPCESVIDLLNKDEKSCYFTENNEIFIDESGLHKQITKLDTELKPKYAFYTKYDILMGSKNCTTPFRYHTKSRKFLYVARGTDVRIKMASWKYTKYLQEIKDYENLDFKSNLNVWINNETDKDLDKIQFLEFVVPVGFILSIPSYWWYSIKYEESETVIIEYNYTSLINNLAHTCHFAKFYLQQRNTIKHFSNSVKLFNFETNKQRDSFSENSSCIITDKQVLESGVL